MVGLLIFKKLSEVPQALTDIKMKRCVVYLRYKLNTTLYAVRTFKQKL